MIKNYNEWYDSKEEGIPDRTFSDNMSEDGVKIGEEKFSCETGDDKEWSQQEQNYHCRT